MKYSPIYCLGIMLLLAWASLASAAAAATAKKDRMYHVKWRTLVFSGGDAMRRNISFVVATWIASGFVSAWGSPVEAVKPQHVQPAASVMVNQIGYDSSADKRFLLQIRDGAALSVTPSSFELLDGEGKAVFAGRVSERGRVHQGTGGDWGAHYWAGDFTGFDQRGQFRVRVKLGTGDVVSFPFCIGDGLLFGASAMPAARFFRWQRCGYEVAGFHPPCHLDDARIPDGPGGHRDAIGGWHNAGDYNKYISIACRSVYALLTLTRTSRVILSERERKALLDEGVWGAEFLRKMWQPGKGIAYQDVFNGYSYFGSPEKETDNRAGTPDDRPFRGEGASAMTAAALAAAAGATGRSDFQEAAEDLWRGAMEKLDVDTEDPWVITSGRVPNIGDDAQGRLVRRTADLLLADLELERLTGAARYSEGGQRRAQALCRSRKADGMWPTDVYSRTVLQGVPAAALALYVRAHPQTPTADETRTALRGWLAGMTRLADNPFGIVPWSEGVFFNPHVGKSWYVGQNSQYLSQAWALYLVSELLGLRDGRRLADRQLDWVLGLNPLNLCMMEGQGSFNPPWYHSRASSQLKRGAVPGSVANGICRAGVREDRPWFDLPVQGDALPDWHTAEPWEPHNAFYLLVMSAR